ncbi:MAG: TonB-dependent receptor [Gammaproteobacteria bacterium]|nr:TonB-dependent receptor [Gammaproteobacteria bacterium]MDP2141626.1 TonB-dependent receptor [Gammaproteobacteria bacterium]MDP2346347.1 TonB-dependent receptor [Gammaproteobacteria bacterium]
MPHITRRGNLRYLIHSCLAASLTLPVIAHAQSAAPEVEEVVVTGSYIRNSKFTGASPVDTVSQEDLFQSGSPTIAQYIRNLTYTQNTNTVSNVLASSDGAQTSNGAQFNLRGLGENSTLALMDGSRVVSSAVTALLPDIATARMEVVLDGGSALYGSDAVAGVVNLIPIKEFDGFRARAYYSRTEDGAMEEPSISFMFGKSFSNDVNWVTAYEFQKKTPLMQFERPREWYADDGSSTSGNPGMYRRVTNGKVNVGAGHGGTITGASIIDPSCGTYNQGYEDLTAAFNTPSGVRTGTGAGLACRFNYTKMFAYAGEIEEQNLYSNVTWETTDWLQLELQTNLNFQFRNTRSTSTTAVTENNRLALLVPANHPANPFGFDVIPYDWRPFTDIGTVPSHLEGSTGAQLFPTREYTDRWKFSARFDLSDTWTGTASYSRQENRQSRKDQVSLVLPRMQNALQGKGGPNGNEYFNPFGSADKRSPFYVAGVTSNSQELVDWMFGPNNGTASRNKLEVAEVIATGELFNLPAGAVQMATGYQWRDTEILTFANGYSEIKQNYNTNIFSVPPVDEELYNSVKAVFVEIEVPVLETLSMQFAGRHERFGTYGLDATTPKVALRWEALPTLAVRASWGESFLAPTPTDVKPFDPNSGCSELFSGTDPFTTLNLTGATTCVSGNPGLQPETSTIRNIGFTWEPDNALDGLSVSIDYQEVEYIDRIRAITNEDVVRGEFGRFLAETGLTAATYNNAIGSPTRLIADAWVRNNTNVVTRDPVTQRVIRVIRQPQNISSVWIDLIDARVRYTYDTGSWGTLQTTLTTSYFMNYEYEDLTGGVRDANGFQNARTGIVPPLPKYKGNLSFNWFMDKHSASLTSNFYDDVIYDNTTVDRYGLGLKAPRKIKGQDIWNIQYAYVFDQYFDSEITVSAGLTNMFDQMPQRTPEQGGFESRLQDPFGRRIWLSLDWTPGA